jgi:HAMP domain-containing protein
MKSNASKVLSLGVLVLLAASAFAASKGSLQLTSPTVVAGKQLAQGDYTVKWEGSGPAVEASIMKGKTVVATVPAHLVELERASNSNAAVVHKSDDGNETLNQIRFSGKKYALEVSQETTANASENNGK